jgi:3-hydroxymyristoyl/3-hydroxydecanoyl-(acyl carrier protein) dehydratase
MGGGPAEEAAAARRFAVPADHPALPGHFPGRPVVPGVLLLDAVLQAAGLSRTHLLRAKFAAPVGPGDPVDILLARRGGDPARLAFTCRCRGTVVLSGELACRPPSDPAP